MICPNCQTENPPGSKFCNECGQKLSAKCAICEHDNPPGAKFCNECGAPLIRPIPQPHPTNQPSPKPPPSSSPLQSLIPTDFAAKLHHARETRAMAGERRVVTMLFCDVQGSTAAAGQLDPEDWAQIMNGVFEQMIRPVYKYEGTVARLMGDAILAFFGAPVAHEDDPQRAILAGMGIIEGFAPYRAQIEKDWGLEINVRVGINTGLVMVGTVGSDLQMEYTALGDAINLAARMEQTATPGTVQVSEDTYKLVAPVFEWQSLGTVSVKGKDEPIPTFRPLQPKTQPGRLRGIEGLDAPMVGRTAELEKLQAAIQRLEQGVGSIIFITGEAGLGKSRLIRELYPPPSSLPSSPLPPPFLPLSFHETASFSYEASQPYALFQRLLRRVCGVEEGDTSAEMWEKFMPILSLIPADVPDQGGVFEALFAFQGSAKPVPDGETFKRQLFALMERIWQHWTAAAPRVLIFDDLHWTDPASVELLTHLFSLTDSCPLAIVCATRPDRESPGWSAKESASKEFPHRFLEINIHPLTAKDTNQLVDKLLTISDLPAKLRQRILEKTDGNPFFIEEVVRTLIDNGLVVREVNGDGIHWRAVKNIEDIEIPGSLQALLIARIDKLEDSARRTLQLASVIGRSFYFRVLEAINQAIAVVQDELDRQLTTLQRAELIREAARVPELEYIFRHSLTQEAAYSTILLRQRREFHRQVGEAIEHLFPARVEEFAPVLGHHFGEAGDPRAVRYEILAGDGAFRLFAIPEALGHYLRGLALARRHPVQSEALTHLFRQVGRCYELLAQQAEAVRIYEEMIAKAQKAPDRKMQLAGLTALGTLLSTPSPVQDSERARALAEQALALARELGNQRAESRALWNFLLVYMYSGRMDLGIPYGEQSAEIARKAGFQDRLAYALQDLSLAYMSVGELQNGRRALLEALPLWRALGNKPTQAETLINIGFERMLSAEFDEAVAAYEEGYAIAASIQNAWGQVNGRAFMSQIYLARGEIDTALAVQNAFIPKARGLGHPGSALVLVQQAWTYALLGLPEKARPLAEEAVADSVNFAPFLHYAQGVAAVYALREGDADRAHELLHASLRLREQKTLLIIDIVLALVDAEFQLVEKKLDAATQTIDDLLALLNRSGARYFLLDALRLKTEILLAQDRKDEAMAALLAARQAATQIGFLPHLWQILAHLAQFAQQKGETTQAQAFLDEARPVVQSILAHLTDAELRTAFLAFVRREGIEIK